MDDVKRLAEAMVELTKIVDSILDRLSKLEIEPRKIGE